MIKKLILSRWLFFAFLIPLLMFFSLNRFLLQLPVSFIFDSKVFKIYASIAVALLFIKGCYYLFQKRFFYGGTLLFITLSVITYYISYELRFKGYFFVTEGSGIERHIEIERGALVQIPQIPIVLKKIEGNRCIILIESQEYKLDKGQEIVWKNYRIIFENIKRTVLLQLKNAKKTLLDEGLMELSREDRKYFMFPLLPHRFFISSINPEREYWKLEGNEWKKVKKERVIAGEKKFHLLILRGKLTVLEQDIKEDEDIAFEGHYLNVKAGPPVAVFLIIKK